jgi:hypothetical protein
VKPLFFLLCVLNLGFFLWQFHSGKLSPVVARETQSGVNLLTVEEYRRALRGSRISTLVEEDIRRWQLADVEYMLAGLRGPVGYLPAKKTEQPLKPRPVVKEIQPEKPLQPIQPLIVRKCFEAGPFQDEANAQQWLAQKALSSKQILARDKITGSDFQVYYPAAKTSEQSRSDKFFLKDKGLLDIWMIQEGDKKGAFSLGVFNDKARAVLFKTQLAARGITSEIRQRDKTQSQWFAKLMLDKASLTQYESSAIQLSPCTNK